MERIHEILRNINIVDIISSTQFKIASLISRGLGTFLSFVYGKTNVIWIFILMMVVGLDWITGSKASKLDGTYSSQYGIEGIARTVVLFFLPCLAHMFDIVFKLPDFFFFMVTGGLIYHIFNSFAANWDQWIPTWLLESVSSEIEAKIKRAYTRKKRR
ncbi:phage holin family protein [Bacillus cereus]|nr:phage holin family protein [Bacillus cereus]